MNAIGVLAFVIVWAALFGGMAYFGQTRVRYDVHLIPGNDDWVCRYTFFNEGRLNRVRVDIEKTWLNGIQPIGYVRGQLVDHGENCQIDLHFPKTAASLNRPARLRSWWQWSSGGAYHMQPMDLWLAPEKSAE